MVLTAYVRALPGVRDLIVTVTRGSSARLAPAQGCQYHTISPVRFKSFAFDPKRPPHPVSTFRDDGEASLLVRRDGINETRVTKKRKKNIFAASSGQAASFLNYRTIDLPDKWIQISNSDRDQLGNEY
jgi:hypothetical protein